MDLREGQIYEGNISLSGSVGPKRRWIVISPFGKTHIHSIDDPIELHCWPIPHILNDSEAGQLKLITTDVNHPVVQLQRAKEKHDIRDSHMGLHGESLHKMLSLLEEAAVTGQPYTPFAAGEILALMDDSLLSSEETGLVREQVEKLLQSWEALPHSDLS